MRLGNYLANQKARLPWDRTRVSNNEETLENNVSIFRLAFILSGSPKYGISSYVISVEEPDKMKANLIITLFSSVSSLFGMRFVTHSLPRHSYLVTCHQEDREWRSARISTPGYQGPLWGPIRVTGHPKGSRPWGQRGS